MRSKSPEIHLHWRLVPLLTLVVVAAVAVLAAPAVALTSTSLNVQPQRTTVNWGAKGILNGALSTAASPAVLLDGQIIEVWHGPSSGGPWASDGTVTNDARPYTTGAYTFSWTASSTYYWKMSYVGSGDWAGTESNVVKVGVRAVVGKPKCPSSIRARKRFAVSGVLKPRFPKGSRTVTVKLQRYSSGKWKFERAYKATNANAGSYSKYSVKIKLSKKGKYRFYCTTARTSTLAAGKSRYSRTLRVK